MSAAVEHLAKVAADAFYDAAGVPERWSGLPEYKRDTFRRMVERALATGRQYRNVRGFDLAPTIGRVVSDAFMEDQAPRWLVIRYDWTTGVQRHEARPIFLAVAESIIAAGRAMNAERERSAA